MKKIFAIGVAVLIAFLVGCTQANDNKNKVDTTPINYKTTIELPESVTVKKGATSSIMAKGVMGAVI